ncbi:MAG: dihydrofolate reductase family protein, partial [Saprospiraceae bacterium]
KKRSMVDAIMVGSRTILLDDPQLTTRDYEGHSPDRVIYDPNGMLSSKFRVFNDDGCRVFYFSKKENLQLSGNHIIRFLLTDNIAHPEQILTALFSHRIGILLVEGGAYLLQLFIDQDVWDEAWLIRTEHLLDNGFKAPVLRGRLIDRIRSASDEIQCIARDMSMSDGIC